MEEPAKMEPVKALEASFVFEDDDEFYLTQNMAQKSTPNAKRKKPNGSSPKPPMPPPNKKK